MTTYPLSSGKLQLRADVLSSHPLFACASEAELDAIFSSSERRTYRKGATIYRQGDFPSAFYLLLAGHVSIEYEAEDGRCVTVGWVYPGGLIGTMSLVDGDPRQESAIAAESSEVLMLPLDEVRDFVWRHTEAMKYLVGVLAARWRGMSQLLCQQMFLPAAGRIAFRLVRLANELRDGPEAREQPIIMVSQAELAAMVGSTRESVNRWLHHFERQGLIKLERGSIRIVDMEGLQDLIRLN